MLAKGEIITHRHNTYARHFLPWRCPQLSLYFMHQRGNAVESSANTMSLHLLLVDLPSPRLMGLRLLLSQEKARVKCIDVVTVIDALPRQLSTGAFDLIIAHSSLVPDITILPSDHFVLLVAQPDRALFQTAREYGALGYLSENPSQALLLAALDLRPGDFLIDPVFGRWAFHCATPRSEPIMLLDSLTEQERKIVVLRQCGLSGREIADHLYITESTVKRHLANIAVKRKQSREQE